MILETQELLESMTNQFNKKLQEVKYEALESHKLVLGKCEANEIKFAKLQKNDVHAKEMESFKESIGSLQKYISFLDSKDRRKSFIIRNVPEKDFSIDNQNVSGTQQAVASVADALGLRHEAEHLQNVYRIGRPRDDNRPRLIMVETTERTAKLFLSKARKFKDSSTTLLKRVFCKKICPYT